MCTSRFDRPFASLLTSRQRQTFQVPRVITRGYGPPPFQGCGWVARPEFSMGVLAFTVRTPFAYGSERATYDEMNVSRSPGRAVECSPRWSLRNPGSGSECEI